MLWARGAGEQCAARTRGRSSGLQDPTPEYGNWEYSSRKYIFKASSRASSEISDCLTMLQFQQNSFVFSTTDLLAELPHKSINQAFGVKGGHLLCL